VKADSGFKSSKDLAGKIVAVQLGTSGESLLNEDLMKRAHKMGENIMTAIKTPPEERKWLGEEDMGWCPNCHSNALVLGEVQWDGLYYPVECQVCGAGGTLEQTDDGKWKFVIAPNGLLKDRTTIEGRAKHLQEIGETQGGFFADPHKQKLVAERKQKYLNMKFKGID
ncbi:MAG: flavodoxin family protein, partial [Lachnospiraceae bacterium]